MGDGLASKVAAATQARRPGFRPLTPISKTCLVTCTVTSLLGLGVKEVITVSCSLTRLAKLVSSRFSERPYLNSVEECRDGQWVKD